MSEMNDWNTKIIEEFRANQGKLGGVFAGSTMLILTTTGVKSGKTRENPLGYQADGDKMYVFASKAGAPTNPDWYYNLLANPTVTVEAGTEKFEATATEITGAERDRIWADQVALVPQFGEYERATTRKIPVVALTRK